MDSAKLLLIEMENEADIFQIETVPGVVALAWGIHKTATQLKGQIVEVVIDATCESIKCRTQNWF